MDTLSTDARELDLFADNSADLHTQYQSIIGMLQKRLERGTYDASKAPKAWMHWYESARQGYRREHGYWFPLAVVREAANARAEYEEQRIRAGEHGSLGADRKERINNATQ